jgi:hypothetical protein
MVHRGKYRKSQSFIGNVSCRNGRIPQRNICLFASIGTLGGALETRSLEQSPDQMRKHEVHVQLEMYSFKCTYSLKCPP